MSWHKLDNDAIFGAIDATWAPATMRQHGSWILREGRGGGNRVSAASLAASSVTDADVSQAEAGMRAMAQPPLFMIRPGDDSLDQMLVGRGYEMFAPVRILGAAAETIADGTVLGADVIPCDTVLAAQRQLWAAGGIGPARIDIMYRVSVAKTALFARNGHALAGVAFVGVSGRLGLLHALEVCPSQRRKGVGAAITAAAAAWCVKNGADTLALLVTRENSAAIALYEGMGMRDITSYHYRIKNE